MNVRLTNAIELDPQCHAVVVQVVSRQLDRAFTATPRACYPAFFGSGDLGTDEVLRRCSLGRRLDRIEVQLNFSDIRIPLPTGRGSE